MEHGMRSLNIATETSGDATLLSLEGELDLGTAAELDVALRQAVQPGARRLVVDLRGLDFVDSTGLELFVRHERRAREVGRQLLLVKGPPHVQRVFEVTGLVGLLAMVDAPPPWGAAASGEVA